MPPPARSHPSLSLAWELGHAPAPGETPREWVPARLPGAVQQDWAEAHGWPPYWQGDTLIAYRWMEDVWWTYRTTLPDFNLGPGETLHFCCGSVDFHACLIVDGRLLAEHTGLYAPWEHEVTGHVRPGSTVEIRLSPAPKAPASADDRTQARLTTKPAVAYSWDFHPRLIPLGLPLGAHFECRPARRWLTTEVTTSLTPDLATGHLSLQARAVGEASTLEWTVASPSGKIVAHGEEALDLGVATRAVALPNPELWWPHDNGPQSRYTVRLDLRSASGENVDSRTHVVGFRRVRLVMHPGAWAEPVGFPKSRSLPPTTFEVNGRRIFIRGTNWVPPEVFPARITPDRTLELLTLVRGAHLNLVRCWGGGIAPPDAFFDQCDELGLLVWQEFPLGCNDYPDDEAYLKLLDQESRALIARARRHPCLALWCGGNELFNAWSGMTDQSLALRLLNRNTLELDPQTPFLPTAPVEGMGHGDYRFRDDQGREVFQIYRDARFTAYSEFGCPGLASLDVLGEIIPAGEIWPMRPGTAWEVHHALNAWPVDPTTWSMTSTLEHYFGPSPDLETLVSRGQWLQAEGYKAIFEETRRQKPRNGMSLNWCFNEPWPTAANNSLVSWPARPKPAYHAVAAACRPTCLSARISRFQYTPGEEIVFDIWILHDGRETLPAGQIAASVDLEGRRLAAVLWSHGPVPADTHLAGPTARITLPQDLGADRLTIHIESLGQPAWNSSYTLSVRKGARGATSAGTRALNT